MTLPDWHDFNKRRLQVLNKKAYDDAHSLLKHAVEKFMENNIEYDELEYITIDDENDPIIEHTGTNRFIAHRLTRSGVTYAAVFIPIVGNKIKYEIYLRFSFAMFDNPEKHPDYFNLYDFPLNTERFTLDDVIILMKRVDKDE